MNRKPGDNVPLIKCEYIDEPKLRFADGYEHVDPKTGILNSAPKSYAPQHRHPATIRVGFIGSAETIEKAKQWLIRGTEGIPGDENHPPFPGFREDAGFRSRLVFDNNWIAQIYQTEIDEILKIRRSRERFERMLFTLEEKLKLLTNKDLLPEYVIVAIPSNLYRECRVTDYVDKNLGETHRDLRRAFKAIAMRYRIPTQLIKQETIEDETGDVLSKISWNFFTGLYFKAGGFPWGPVGLTPGTCYIGISFFRPLGSSASTMQTSLVQAFDEYGDGLVLRGYNFEWDPNKEGSKSPHLNEAQAYKLIELIIDRYKQEMGQTPQRVVVHKTSRYWPAEKNGFTSALKRSVVKYDLMALTRQSTVRIINFGYGVKRKRG